MNKLTAEQRIERANVQIMGHKSTMAFSGLVMVGKSEVLDAIPTACTNGRDVMYGRDFVGKLTDQEVVGVVLHEQLHKAYSHAWLWRHLWKEDAKLANRAADYVINCEIKDIEKQHPGFIKLPDCGLYDAKYRGMDTQEVFNLLKEGGEGQGQGQGQGDDSGEAEGFDEHSFDELSGEEQEAVGKEVDNALRQGQLMAGKMGGEESRLIGALTEPKVDWREQLREFMSAVSQGCDDSTWKRPNRRWIGEDLYMPSRISESMGSLVVAIDTSGSICGELVSSFLSEVVGLCQNVQPEVLHLLEVDAKVQAHEVYDQTRLDQLSAKQTLAGGGGTDMREIFAYVDKNNIKPEAIVVLTDGMTPFPDTLSYPTLWAITEKYITAPCGTTIHI